MIFNSAAIASDHRGYWMKKDIMDYFKTQGYEFSDQGTDSDCLSVDYPDFSKRLTDYVASHEKAFGILICYSGIGMSIAANRIKGIRAVLCSNEEQARLSRVHNNANVICFGAGFINHELAIKCIDVFVNTEFDERHLTRIQKIDTLD